MRNPTINGYDSVGRVYYSAKDNEYPLEALGSVITKDNKYMVIENITDKNVIEDSLMFPSPREAVENFYGISGPIKEVGALVTEETDLRRNFHKNIFPYRNEI